jgi:hypothetical protein
MRLLLFALMIASRSEVGPAASIHLEIDGDRRGVFASMEHPRDGGATVILEEGWVDGSLFQAWGVRDVKLLQPGEHRLERGVCRPRRLTIRQVFGAGLRQAGRSWTLLDACPVAWEVEAARNDESDRLRLRQLTLTSGPDHSPR